MELGHQIEGGQQAEEDTREEQVVQEGKALGGKDAFGQAGHGLEVLDGELYLQDIHHCAHKQLQSGAAYGRYTDHHLVGRIAHQPAGHVDAYGDGEELFHLAQAAELPQHDLAEHQLAGSGAQRRGHGIKQHRQR